MSAKAPNTKQGEDDKTNEATEDTSTAAAAPADNNATATTDDNTTATAQKPEWSGDNIPQETLNKVRTKFGLSEEQMKLVMDKSRRGESIEEGQQFHKTVNRLVYVLAFSVLFYVLNRDYNDYASFWFAHYFPKEAGTLGMFVPEPRK